MTAEQMEAVTAAATDDLWKKMGPNSTVIVMVMEHDGRFHTERRGTSIMMLWLLETCHRIIKDMLLGTSTMIRIDKPGGGS